VKQMIPAAGVDRHLLAGRTDSRLQCWTMITELRRVRCPSLSVTDTSASSSGWNPAGRGPAGTGLAWGIARCFALCRRWCRIGHYLRSDTDRRGLFWFLCVHLRWSVSDLPNGFVL